MKKLTLLLSLLLSTLSVASTTSENEAKALSLLLAANPTITNYADEKVSLLEAIAPYMLTTLNDENRGRMGVLTNSCEEVKNAYECQLYISNSDVELNDNGDYVKSEDSTESAIIINYKIDLNVKKIIGEIEYFYAG